MSRKHNIPDDVDMTDDGYKFNDKPGVPCPCNTNVRCMRCTPECATPGYVCKPVDAEMEQVSELQPTIGKKTNSWEIVKLKARTDIYRCYTYRGKRIFCGIHSDTVSDESREEVVEIVTRSYET